MVTIYPAIFFKEEDGGYTVVFPDLNHLASQGDDLDEAMYMAIDCLAGYIYSEWEDKNQLPKPSDISEFDAYEYWKKEFADDEEEFLGGFVTYVSVDVEEYAKLHFNKAVKKTLTIPYWLNQLAIKNKVNFSKVLKEALMDKLL